ncbi:MAG: MMPL family transporter, partial [Crocinitomicaceae bacterium]
TGSAFLLDKNIRYLSNSLIYGLLLSIGVVSVIMGFVFKSIRMVIISIIPNTIPLIFIAAVMGYLGIEVKTSTSIIFTIAFGIAVDDTIHLLGKFKFELMKGKSVRDALKHAFVVTGKAMILTTLVLCSGFLLLLFSTFMGTFNMGLLLSMTLFIALILDLTLLPLLIYTFYRSPKQPQA